MNTKHFAAALALAALGVLACNKSENKASPGGEPDQGGKIDMAKAQTIFNERCAACHGTEGKGNGPASAALTPKPRDYTDKAWQKSVTDEQLRKAITLGGAAVGKSPIMPSSPDLDEKPEVVEGLVRMVRKFGG